MADVIFRTRKPAYPLTDYIADRREGGATWGEIADSIAAITDGAVTVGRDTVRRWHEGGKDEE